MQGDKIVERILLDASNTSSQILTHAQEKAEMLELEAKEFVKNQTELANKKMIEDKEFIKEKYNTLLKIEQRKLLLKSKQNLIKDLKNEVLSVLLNKSKKELLNFVELLLTKNASKGETVLFNLEDIEEKDLSTLSIVKKLELKVVKSKGLEKGIILEGKNVDKNLIFVDLIEKTFEENQEEINSLLF